MSERKIILLVDSFADEQDMHAEFLRFSGFELALSRTGTRTAHGR